VFQHELLYCLPTQAMEVPFSESQTIGVRAYRQVTEDPVFPGTSSRLHFPTRLHSANYLPVSELSSFSSHEIRVIWKVISCPLKAN